MTLASGTRIGGYEITRLLGSGGMGEVYRAHDSRLNRDVAIKVLLPSVANDAERLARFAREAQVLASLDHPNIAHIHGLEPSDPDDAHVGVRALVMELVEGPTLADRLTKGALPVDEAIEIATQIAEALQAAHDHGVIHRDLKPANVKVREDGTVKVLDFGLAKAIVSAVGSGESGSAQDVANSPTITTPAMTQAGVILGTAAYMSPEQARGRAVDKRSDVWAFGAVLYEMLTGTRPFDGEHVADVLGAVVRLEPDWSRLPADTTAAVRSLVQGCLVKDRRHRVGDMAAALFVLKTSTTLAAVQGRPSSKETRHVLRIAVASALGGAAAAGLVAALLVGTGVVGAREAPAEAVVRFTIEAPDFVAIPARPAISPDGRLIAIQGSDLSLWLRRLDQVSMQRLAGTEGGTQPFWSPDSRSVGFFADGKLKRVEVVGGLPVTLCDVGANPGGGSWSPQGVILFAPDALSSPIHRVSAEGGVPVPVTQRDSASGALGHYLPYFLPDGRHFFYRRVLSYGSFDRTRIGSLGETLNAEVGLSGDTNALYANGSLLFVRGTTLMQQPFDAATLVTSGHPTPIAENVVLGLGNTGSFDVSPTGTLVYFTDASERRLQIAWVDRQGRLTKLSLPPGYYGDPALSPDGRQIALSVADDTGQHIWVYDLERGTSGKRTFEGVNEFPLWSRDGRHLVFSTEFRRGPLMMVRADGSGRPEPLITDEQRFRVKVATSWSADGGLMIFQNDQDIFVRNKDGSLDPVIATPASEREGRFAPTGPWLAYSSNETGRREVYVQSFPTGRGKWTISTDGGAQPMWAPGGGELFYKSGNRMMVVPVEAGAMFKPGTPRVLFEMPMPERSVGDAARFVVSPDAARFMVLTPASGEVPSRPSLNVILNWPALAKATTAP